MLGSGGPGGVGDERAKDRPKAAPSPAPEADTARLRLVQAQAPGASHDVAGDILGLNVPQPGGVRRGRSSEGATPMTERKCKTCEFRGGHGCAQCRPRANLPLWYVSRAALEAEVADLTAKLEAEGHLESTRGRIGPLDLASALVSAESERDAAVREGVGLRAQVARLESERAGLRHSISEVQDELEEMRKWRDAARAAAKIAQADAKRDRARLLEQIEHAGCVASGLGERSYQCRAESLCGLCRGRERVGSTSGRSPPWMPTSGPAANPGA